MPATRHARPTPKSEDDEALKRAAPGPEGALDADSDGSARPGLPDLNGGPLEPAVWLALQQAIGNNAVGGLVASRRAGQPLPADTRRDMEASFGRDFGRVRIHTGPDVDRSVHALGAAAFTVGSGIFIDSGLPGFDDPFGRQVLGEELAHVAQGVGTGEVERLTNPGEAAERAAGAAGKAVSAGDSVHVAAAPEAAGAAARFGLDDIKKIYESVTGGTDTATRAAKAVRTELTDEDKQRLLTGAMEPLILMQAALGMKQAEQGGKVDPKSLQPIADNTAGLSKFIMAFDAPPAVQPTLEAAAMATAAGRNALLAAIDPANLVKDVADGMGSTAAEIEGIAAAAPAPAATPGGEPAETLTAAEAEQLRSGAVEPLRSVSEQLKGDAPDLHVIVARLYGVPGMLRTFTKPAAIVPQLRRKAMSVEVQVRALQAVMDGSKGAVDDAVQEWANAIGLLSSLTVKSAAGAAAETTNATDPGDDDDQQKPN